MCLSRSEHRMILYNLNNVNIEKLEGIVILGFGLRKTLIFFSKIKSKKDPVKHLKYL